MRQLTAFLQKEFTEVLRNSKLMICALTSWEQFYKNMPMGIVIFVLMFSGIVATELQKGTLINIVTKGMQRWKIMAAKTALLLVLWTGMYFLSYIITYIYNDFYWDNGLAKHLLFSAFCLYFFGVWLISLIMIMSSWVDNSASVSIGTCGIFVACYMLSMIPKLQEYLPTKLMACSELPFGVGETSDYVAAIAVVAVWSVANIVIGIIIFNKKNL